MRFAISSDQDEEEGLYHYLPDGGNLTSCGREPHQVLNAAPDDRNICEVCDRTEFSSMLKTLDDKGLSQLGWDLIKGNRSRHNHLLLVNLAVERNLPICRGTRLSGPHAAIPLTRGNGQSSPCPVCGDVKRN